MGDVVTVGDNGVDTVRLDRELLEVERGWRSEKL